MTKLTKSIQLVLISSVLILDGCFTRRKKDDTVSQERRLHEERRQWDQALLGASTTGLLAAPQGQGPLLAATALHPAPAPPPPPAFATGATASSGSGTRSYYHYRYYPWWSGYYYRNSPGPSSGYGRPGSAGRPGRGISTTTRGGFGSFGRASAGG